jgi:CRP/FNR family transcriptional regulator, cyclic AMP receptor protein
MDKVNALKRSDLFYNLSQEQLQTVANLAEERHVLQDEVIFREGDSSREVFVIISGSVEVSHCNYNQALYGANKQILDSDVVVLATLSTGQSFGEIAFIDKANREASVICRAPDTVLLSIGADALMALCEANPALGFLILRNIAKDLAFIIRELDLHMLGQVYWNGPVMDDES